MAAMILPLLKMIILIFCAQLDEDKKKHYHSSFLGKSIFFNESFHVGNFPPFTQTANPWVKIGWLLNLILTSPHSTHEQVKIQLILGFLLQHLMKIRHLTFQTLNTIERLIHITASVHFINFETDLFWLLKFLLYYSRIYHYSTFQISF